MRWTRLLVKLLVAVLPSVAALMEDELIYSAQFRKEILLGRCYADPPTGNVMDCPSFVDGFLSILESHKDEDISIDTYSELLVGVNVSIPETKTLVFHPYLHYGSMFEMKGDPPPPSEVWSSYSSSIITPEYTATGSMLRNMMFCGNDTEDECYLEESSAYWSFWWALNRLYVSHTQGELHLVATSPYYDYFLQEGVIRYIRPDQISKVTLYVNDCSSEHRLVQDLIDAGIRSRDIECVDDPLEFLFCTSDPSWKECRSYRKSVCHAKQPTDSHLVVEPTQIYSSIVLVLFGLFASAFVLSCYRVRILRGGGSWTTATGYSTISSVATSQEAETEMQRVKL